LFIRSDLYSNGNDKECFANIYSSNNLTDEIIQVPVHSVYDCKWLSDVDKFSPLQKNEQPFGRTWSFNVFFFIQTKKNRLVHAIFGAANFFYYCIKNFWSEILQFSIKIEEIRKAARSQDFKISIKFNPE
jgi:hypothetical protein